MFLYLAVHALLLTTSPTLQAQARQALAQQLPADCKIIINKISVQGQALPLKQLTEVEAVAKPEHGHARLRLQYQDEKGQRMTRWARVELELCAAAWVANKRLLPNQILQARDLRRQNRCGLDAQQLADPAKNPVGQRIRRALRKGDVLNAKNLRAAPLLKRGEHVRLRWRRGGIEILSEAEVLDDAMQGQKLRLKRLGGQKVLRAVAVAQGLAELQ